MYTQCIVDNSYETKKIINQQRNFLIQHFLPHPRSFLPTLQIVHKLELGQNQLKGHILLLLKNQPKQMCT
jgi:hypothetical protein